MNSRQKLHIFLEVKLTNSSVWWGKLNINVVSHCADKITGTEWHPLDQTGEIYSLCFWSHLYWVYHNLQIMTKVVHLKVHVIICTKSHARKSGDVAREAVMITQHGGGREVVQSWPTTTPAKVLQNKNVQQQQFGKQSKSTRQQKWNNRQMILGKNRKLF